MTELRFDELHGEERADVAEDVAALLESADDLDLSPAFRTLLLALDEALGSA